MRRRFEQEARAGARIESDYVVAVIGAGVDEATRMPWIAMELLDGEDLADHVERLGKLPVGEVLAILRMGCHAMAAAHDAGIVPRDLKPENIYLARSRRPDEPFTVKVLDFGIARASANVHGTGTAALGTPLWMAPEQTTRGSKIAPPTHVWALGLIVYDRLTGARSWRTAHLEEPSMTEFFRELTLEPLEVASLRATDMGLGVLPDGFDAWFARCVARDPTARFADARAAFAALEPVLANATAPGDVTTAGTRPVAPAPLSATPSTASASRRRRRIVPGSDDVFPRRTSGNTRRVALRRGSTRGATARRRAASVGVGRPKGRATWTASTRGRRRRGSTT